VIVSPPLHVWPLLLAKAMRLTIDAPKSITGRTSMRPTVVQAAGIDGLKGLVAATIEKGKVGGASLVEKERAIEVARREKEVSITQAEEALARASAARATAQADEERAEQEIVTVEATAKAERERAISIIEAAGRAEEKRIDAQASAAAATEQASAILRIAEAERQKGLSLAEARRAMVEAENAVGDRLLLRDVAVKALSIAPDLARELMLPAQKITEIKVLQANGLFGGSGADGGHGSGMGAIGAMSPIMKTIMEAGAAYPLVRELMAFGKVDGQDLGNKVRELIGQASPELTRLLEAGGAPLAPSPTLPGILPTTLAGTAPSGNEPASVSDEEIRFVGESDEAAPTKSNGHAAMPRGVVSGHSDAE